MDPTVILTMSITDLAAALRSRRVTSVEVLQAFKTRCVEVDRACNAITCFVDEAETWAQEADEHIARTGEPVGPLHGVPFTVKDHYALKGYPVLNFRCKLPLTPFTRYL
jgi:amidase